MIGGFLAGTGWLLFKGGLGLLTGTALSLATVSQFFRPELLGRWVPGLAFAVVVLASVRRYGHFLIIPGAVLGAAVLFFLVLLPFGSLHEAEAGGWLLGPLPAGGLWRPWLPSAISGADWGAVLGQLGSVATVVLLSVVALLLNATGIELVAGRDVDLNRELRVAGVANVASSLGGGIVGFQALTLTALAQRTGTASRLVGVVAAVVCGVALLFGASLLGLFPRVVLGGLIVSLGIAFLTEWLLDGWRKLPRSDYAVVLVIVLVIATLGFLQGVGVGILLAVVLFVIEYSRTDVVRSQLSAATFRSNVDRPPAHEEAIRSAGERVSILLLQGHLFFGTANRLLERVRTRILDAGLPRLEFLVLDFGRVSALDSSAVLSFGKAQKLAEAHGFELVFAGLSERLKPQMLRAGFPSEGSQTFPDLDRAVQWCEDRLLAEERLPLEAPDPWTDLRDAVGRPVNPERLMPYLERIEVGRDQSVIRQGDPSEDVYFLVSGVLTAQMDRGDGAIHRLRTMGPGTVVGEVAFYAGTPRSASVKGEAPSVTYRLSRRSLERMERRDPELAAALHRMFARAMAARLGDTVTQIRALLA